MAVNAVPYFEDLLSEDPKSLANYRLILAKGADFLRGLMKYGNEVMNLCSTKAQQEQRASDHVLMAHARHNLAYFDSICTLLEKGTPEGCYPLLRSILESTLGIAHIVRDRHEERARAYKLARIKRKIRAMRRADTKHADGKKLHKELSDDAFVPGILDKLASDLSKKADEYEAELRADTAFAPIFAEWERLREPHPGSKSKKKRPDPEWYALFGGAPDLGRLAKKLKWTSMYVFFYREWSDAVHAGNALDSFNTPDGSIRPLRYPKGYHTVVSTAFMLFINCFERLASFYDARMVQQIRDHAVKRLDPEFRRLSKAIKTSLQNFD